MSPLTIAPPCPPARGSGAQPPPIDWSAFDAAAVDPEVVSIVRATCLLESRSARYGAYLERVLPEAFASEINGWADEEAHHGRALRRWLELADPGFDVDRAAAGFDLVPYHQGEGAPRRGGAAQELLSRCVVEALASTYYRALRDRTREPLLRQLCARLMADERRHLELFSHLLSAVGPLTTTQRIRTIVERIRELDDDQIVQASNWADHDGCGDRRTVRDRHVVRVLSMHRFADLRYAHDLLWGLTCRPPARGFPRLASAFGLAIIRTQQVLATRRLRTPHRFPV